jgi:hypothetical protein
MTMEAMAVTKALSWLETQAFTNACVLSDSMSMLRKLEASRMVGVSEAVEFGKYQFYSLWRWLRTNVMVELSLVMVALSLVMVSLSRVMFKLSLVMVALSLVMVALSLGMIALFLVMVSLSLVMITLSPVLIALSLVMVKLSLVMVYFH